MSRRAVGLAALVLTATFLHAQGVQAKTFVVSNTGINCYPSVVGPLYQTIQAAINAVPVATNAAHVVMVCPGTYPEQIKITKNVSITGVLRDGTDPPEIAGNSSEIRIVPPIGGLTRDDAFKGNVAAQVSAQGITDLNLTNLDIEGEGIGCPLGLDGLPMPTAGIALYGVGLYGTAHKATISKSVVHNQIGFCGGQRSFTADGIYTEDSWFTLDANSLSHVDLSPIHQIRGISKITNNYLNLGYKGILLTNVTETYGAALTGSTISSNIVTNFNSGLILDASANVLVSLNTFGHAGIALDNSSTDNEVIKNMLVDPWHGIYVANGAARNTVKSNTIIRAVQVAIPVAFTYGGNIVTGNIINQTPIGIYLVNPHPDNVINPNTYYSTTVLTTTGPSVP